MYHSCCELLSNYYLCDVRNNTSFFCLCFVWVVNCFQIIIFVTSETTVIHQNWISTQLWIAFKLLSLWRQKQRGGLPGLSRACCELLSNYYLCDVRNNWAYWRTRNPPLWIAFKLLSLWRQKQPAAYNVLVEKRCELLSNYYLCDVRNNQNLFTKKFATVVNCFQIIIFVTSETTVT